jgi:2-polyprenyl-3-methyl-5-hydroxy-6-metoxy-1,4-benzoquinol methylase
MDAQRKWDNIYRQKDPAAEPVACQVLSQYAYLLPPAGRALDAASGRGGNALLLARAGLQTTAIDISPVGLEQLSSVALAHGQMIATRAETLSEQSLGVQQWDVIVVSNFLQRDLFESLCAALRPGGLLFYETFVQNKTDTAVGPSNPEFLLDDNELLELTRGLSVRVFFDQQAVGDCAQGVRNKSCLVAQKPTNTST